MCETHTAAKSARKWAPLDLFVHREGMVDDVVLGGFLDHGNH